MDRAKNDQPELPSPPAITGVLTYLFLTMSPFTFLLAPLQQLDRTVFWVLVGVYVVLYVRTLANTTAMKLLRRRPKGRRNFKGSIDEEHLTFLRDGLSANTEGVMLDQLRYFALSILAPRAIRRRVTDEYTPSRRTLTKTVTLELDLNHQFVNKKKSESSEHLFIALTLPRKGALYDQLKIANSGGDLLPCLSHREYRMLAARTLRALLQSAMPDGTLTDDALAAEKLALIEIIRFTQPERSENQSDEQFEHEKQEHDDNRQRAYDAIRALDAEPNQYLELAVEFTAKLANNYAIVAVVPRNGSSRSIVTYSRVIIPDLCLARWMSKEGLRGRLHTMLATRPSSLTISARNAVSCRSYHLIVTASPDLFLGDFDTKPIMQRSEGDELRLEPYWRVRGRRGQNYFHLYARSLNAGKRESLDVNVQFFEVPPGSVARAGAAALATCLVVLVVGFLVRNADIDQIDSQIASFLLAVPGLAAAWMGFETRPDQLFEGTVVARLSLIATFVMSFGASVLLMLNKALLVSPVEWNIFFFAKTDPWWTLLGFMTTIHLLTMGSIWGFRNHFYRSVTSRPVGDSAVIAYAREQ